MKLSAKPMYCARCRALREGKLQRCPVCNSELVTSRWGETPLVSQSGVEYVECPVCHKVINSRSPRCCFCLTPLRPPVRA